MPNTVGVWFNGITLTRERLLQSLASGELHRLAHKCRNKDELARALGISSEAFSKCAERIRASGTAFPTLAELRGKPLPEGEATPAPATPAPKVRTVFEDMDARKDKATISALKSKLADALDKLAEARFHLVTAAEAQQFKSSVKPIKPREKSNIQREATAVALASDWHIEERVDSASVNGVNEYNLEIAHQRVERFFSGFNYLIRYHQDHFAIRDGLLWLGGDLITGYLREENLEHNELSPVQAIATLHVWLAAGIRSILESGNLESLKVVCNSGNHGRLTDKIRPSTREANSIEWLLYNSLARDFTDDPRVEFSLPHGSQTYVEVYDWTIRFLHGDDAKFGGGVGGITIPLYKALARWETVRHADLTCLGHFHQYHDLSDLVINGSLIGYNPYSLSIGARYEEPRQAFFLVDRRRGKTMPADIWVKDIDEE